MAEVKGADYRPPRVGRPPTADIKSFKDVVDANPGLWVEESFTEAHAQSARRQFRALGNYQVMTAKDTRRGRRKVIVMKMEEL